jgi:hypothetical protein
VAGSEVSLLLAVVMAISCAIARSRLVPACPLPSSQLDDYETMPVEDAERPPAAVAVMEMEVAASL